MAKSRAQISKDSRDRKKAKGLKLVPGIYAPEELHPKIKGDAEVTIAAYVSPFRGMNIGNYGVLDEADNFDKSAANKAIKGMIIMPDSLTAENGAKCLLSSEFSESFEVINPHYCECGDCDICEEDLEQETIIHKVPISWTTIKDIYSMAVKHLSQKQTGGENEKTDS